MSKWRGSACLITHAACLLMSVACERGSIGPSGPAERQVRATVLTIRTFVQPSGRVSMHTIVIGPSLARSTDEAQSWRLFDFKQNRVTFIDDIEKTYRTEPVSSLIQQRRRRAAAAPEDDVPEAVATPTGRKRSILGVDAAQILVRMGSYQRELWFGPHPQIPEQLSAMMHASEVAPPRHRASRQLDEFLIAARGFPLADHSEVPFGDKKLVVDRTVLSIQRKNVPASLLQIPRGYRDTSIRPDARPQPSSSPPPGQRAPGAG